MNALRIVLVVGGLAITTSCASTLDAGRDSLAGGDTEVVIYETYLERHPLGRKSDSVRFRLAMLYLSPDSDAHDPGAARGLLWQLAGRSGNPHREGAERVLELLTEVERLRAEAAVSARVAEGLRRETAGLRRAAEAAAIETAEEAESVARLERKVESLLLELGRAREQNAAQTERIDRLAMELRELKRIDTGQI